MSISPDYIIVGAGAAGSVLAARLAEDQNKKVLLIEAGSDNVDNDLIRDVDNPFLLWDLTKDVVPVDSPSHLGFVHESEGKKYSYPRGTGLGGSVNHHAGVDGRGSPEVYNMWAEVSGDSSWSYEGLKPLFKRMERFTDENMDMEVHGSDGWLNIDKSLYNEEVHHDLIEVVKEKLNLKFRQDFYDDPKNYSGIGPGDIQRHPDRTRSYSITGLLLPRLEESKKNGWNNLEIVTDQLVTKIIFEGNRAVGVEVIDQPAAYKVDARHKGVDENAPRKTYHAKKEIILAGGAINTPQIMMLSGLGPKAHLEEHGIEVIKDLPGVGSNMMDHMEVGLTFHMTNLPNKVWRSQAAALAEANPDLKKYQDDSKISDPLCLIMEGFSGYDERNEKHPDLHVHVNNYAWLDFNFNYEKFNDPDPNKGSNFQQIMAAFDPENPVPYLGFLTEVMKLKSKHGTIRLKTSDPTDPPEIVQNLCADDEDLTRLAMGVEQQRDLMRHPMMEKYGPVEVRPGPDFQGLEATKEYIKKYSAYGHHMSCTCMMGSKDDPMAVVDNNLKVFGVEGLRICDASAFPYVPAYNTSRPSYVIGEALADKIKAGH